MSKFNRNIPLKNAYMLMYVGIKDTTYPTLITCEKCFF